MIQEKTIMKMYEKVLIQLEITKARLSSLEERNKNEEVQRRVFEELLYDIKQHVKNKTFCPHKPEKMFRGANEESH